MASLGTCIATWLVIDTEAVSTAFPSVGVDSASPTFQEIYWQCVAVSFFTSKAHNPNRRHVLFTNADVGRAAPPDVVDLLKALDVEIVHLDITYRLPAGSVTSWGNQFYVLDIIKYFSKYGKDDAIVLTDSDCIWRKSLSFEESIFEHDCLLYTLMPNDQKEYEVGQLINGLSHRKMQEIVEQNFDTRPYAPVQYHGGEFFAATRDYCKDIVGSFDALWAQSCLEARQRDSIKEEAHFLSILAESRSIKHSTANGIIRRMWTHFEDFNIVDDDLDLVIWHVPAEKRYGFRRLWQWLSQSGRDWNSFSAEEVNQITTRYMGIPRRDARKFALDVVEKIGVRLKLWKNV